MTEVFIGQIMATAFDFAPRGFALCNGQLLPISQNQALFSLLGTQYGGDGKTTFALPDLRGRTPVGFGISADPGSQAYPIGQTGGAEAVALTTAELPAHSHASFGTSATGTQRNPTAGLYGTSTAMLYAPANGAQVPLNAQTVTSAGSSQPHPNMQPFRTINFCIATTGIFPSRN